jgi:sugar lactone lactonase YvrE
VTDQPVDERDLDRLWNDLTRRTPPNAPYDLPRNAADTVRLFQVLATTPPSDAARERVGLDVMATIQRLEREQTASGTMNRMVVRSSVHERGVQRAVGRIRAWSGERVGRSRESAFAQLATIALLVLTLFGIYWVAWDGNAPGDGGDTNGAAVPATVDNCRSASAPASSSVSVSIRTPSPAALATDTITHVWSSNGAPEAPQLISHISIDPHCRLWVLDQLGNRFLIFDLDGRLLETWGTAGSGDGQFDFGNADFYFLSGIAFARDGGFYVSDAENHRIQQFDADRTFVRAWSLHGDDDAPSDLPSWIAIGPDGNVYVAVYTVDGVIQVYGPDGTFIRGFGLDVGIGYFGRPGPIAFDRVGNLWAVDPEHRSVLRLSLTGEVLDRLELPEIGNLSMGLAIDPAGRLNVVDFDDNSISVFEPDGTFLYAWGELGPGDGEFLNPFGIAFDANGGVYITEGGSPRFQKFQIQS